MGVVQMFSGSWLHAGMSPWPWQHTPDISVRWTLDVGHQMGIVRQRPEAQAAQAKGVVILADQLTYVLSAGTRRTVRIIHTASKLVPVPFAYAPNLGITGRSICNRVAGPTHPTRI